jgi:ATP-dependent DNA ligase
VRSTSSASCRELPLGHLCRIVQSDYPPIKDHHEGYISWDEFERNQKQLALNKLRAGSFTIDGEAAVCGSNGIAVFDSLHWRGTLTEAVLFAFDLLELDGVDYRPLPLGKRKDRLARLVDRRLTGIVMNEHTDARGELVFEQACRMGLEGIVSKRLSKPYQSGRSGHWLKVKNPDSPAMVRHREEKW